jgi:hypothetical protein
MVQSMRLSRRHLVIPIVVVALGSVGLVPDSAAAQQPVTVTIGPGRDAATGTGTATLTDLGGGRTRVDVRANAASPNMPAHIHADVCPGVAAVVFPLTNVMNGTSTTEINASLADIMARGKSINLHQSPQEAQIYVGCGNLPAMGAAAAPAAPAAPAGTAAQPRPAQPAAPAAAAAQPRPAQLPRTGEADFGLYGVLVLGALMVAAGSRLVVGRRSA